MTDENLQDRIALLLDGVGPARLTRVLDIGASGAGDSTYAHLREAGGCEVFGFDAEKTEAEALTKNAEAGARYDHQILGDGTVQTFHCYTHSVLSSLYPFDRATVDYLDRFSIGASLVTSETVETVQLDKLDGVPEIDFLQIDVQGAEEQVLRHGRKTLQGAVGVVTELRFLRLYEGEPMMARVAAELEEQGFTFHKILSKKQLPVPFRGKQRVRLMQIASQWVDGDGVFMRDLVRADAIPTEKLKHLAILAGSVFMSHDITLKCLDILADRGAISKTLSDAYIDLLPDRFLRLPEPTWMHRILARIGLSPKKIHP